jgi:hypothetical protein
MDILALMELWMDNDETVPVERYKCITQFKRQDFTAGEVAIYERNDTTIRATPHLLMRLDTQIMAKKSFKVAASDSCGDICAVEFLVSGRKRLVMTECISSDTPSNDWKTLIFSNFDVYFSKVCKIFKFLLRRSCEDIPIILAVNFNAEIVDFMEDIFELDILSDHSQGTTRSNFCIDMVFRRNVDNLSCTNYVSYLSCHRYILSRNNHQVLQLNDVTTN